jgi:hypothetical protein
MALTNPYTKPNPLSKPLYTSKPKPVTAGGVTVETKKPVLVETVGVQKPEAVETPGFWASKSKKQKTIMIVSGVAIVSLIAYFAFKKK